MGNISKGLINLGFFFLETNTHARERERDFNTNAQTSLSTQRHKQTHTERILLKKKNGLFKGKGYYKVYTLD